MRKSLVALGLLAALLSAGERHAIGERRRRTARERGESLVQLLVERHQPLVVVPLPGHEDLRLLGDALAEVRVAGAGTRSRPRGRRWRGCSRRPTWSRRWTATRGLSTRLRPTAVAPTAPGR